MKLFLEFFFHNLVFVCLFSYTKSDYYTSVVGLENLFHGEKNYIHDTEKYLENVEKVNKEMESFLNEIENDQNKIFENSTKYYGDPVNAFKIIKRLVLDWQHLEDLTKLTNEFQVYNLSLQLPANKFTLPTYDDLNGAARGLVRLQKTYKLDTADVARGWLKDFKYSQDLTAHDSFILGKQLFHLGEHFYSSDWLIEALNKLDNSTIKFEEIEEVQEEKEEVDEDEEDEEEVIDDFNDLEYPFVNHIDVLEYLGAALYYTGNLKLANLMTMRLLQMDPENKHGLVNSDLFSNDVVNERRARIIHKKPEAVKPNEQELYAKVCSGELQLTPKEQRLLRCRYVTNNVPFYFIGPFKMEELYHEPFVAYYHQSIYNGEISKIIHEVEDNVERSKIGPLNESSFNEIRTSKNSWLWISNHEFLQSIYRRLEAITGLTLVSGEPLQVANYGIGGHYGPHYDYSINPDQDYPGKGNRILTALFYINDVELGGATAFPYLRLAVPPIKNSLVVWHNMHKSLEFDYRTKHAGCPVLKGSKWICNEWFHSIGQELKRPCGLKPDGELSITYKDI